MDGRLLDWLRAETGARGLELAESLTPISGGFDTRIFGFRLKGAPPGLDGPLILRVLDPASEPARAIRERAIQNAVAAQGYPAPRAPLGSADPAILGGGFLIMERLPGTPLIGSRRPGMVSVLARSQRALHTLDPQPLLAEVERAAPGSAALLAPDGFLARLESRVVRGPLLGLVPALGWLRAHRPTRVGPPVICHGDFHPLNVLVEGGRGVSGVLDWTNTLVADRAYDVASTRVILRNIPMDVLQVPRSRRWLVVAARLILARRYMRAMRRAGGFARPTLRYYEALACMRQLVRVAENRAAVARNGTALNPLDASRFGERLARRFARLTRVRPALPAIKETTSR
jgi:aminoglycoside phosphotransferase (APT) family kinase protein